MVFGSRQRLCRAWLVLWLWNEYRKKPQLRQLTEYDRRRENKMEIPVQSRNLKK